MLVRTLIAAAALVGLMATGAVTTTAFAQTAGTTAATPAKKAPMKKHAPMHKAMHKAAAKEGHKMDSIADKLNACETKAAADRQSCINSATHM